MLNVNFNYPYPVIRNYLEDYKTTAFAGKMAVNIQPNGYLIRPSFEVNNPGINELIKNGTLTYAVEIQSPATWYRNLFPVKDNNTIHIDPIFVHERVELIPCIIATADISGFSNEDFEDEYQGITFEIKAGDIIAIGETKTFDALYQNDIIKNGSSIVSIGGDEAAKEIICDYSGSIITITLPAEQYKDYTDCGYLKAKHKTLNAILSIPALVEAIGIISNDEKSPDQTSGFESKAWYKTIVVNLKRAAENNEAKYRRMLDRPFASAELLLGNNYVSALQFVSQADLG